MTENLDFEDLDFLLGTKQDLPQNEININQHVQRIVPASRPSSKKKLRLSERIAETDDLVRQLKQLQDNQLQLKDLQRSAGEVTQLFHSEKQQRIELERRVNEQNERCADLEKQLDVQQLNCEKLQEQLTRRALPVDAKDMVTIFMQLMQRVDEDSHASGFLRREHNLLRKIKDYCKSANINIPAMKSSTGKRSKATTAASQVTQTTQTDALQDSKVILPSKPETCSVAVQSENLVTTRNQGTQHKNMTFTRGTTTASFIKKHDVGTSFPEPKPALSVHQILDEMLSWNKPFITPLSPIIDLQPEPEVLQTVSMGTCTDLCNVQRVIDFLPELPTELKRSRPPSRASVKDELTMPAGAAALSGYGHHMAKELLHLLPQSQSILTTLPPHVFEEIWQVMGQMVLVVLQRRSTSSSVPTPMPTMPASTINQADFSSWFDAYESSLNQSQANNKEDAELEVPSETTTGINVGTDPITPPPPQIGLDLTPIRLLVKPKFRVLPKPKPKPKKKKRRVVNNLRVLSKREKIASKTAVPIETAVQFLSNLNVFKSPICDNLDTQLDAEERQLLELTSAAEKNEQQSPVASLPRKDQMKLLFDSNDESNNVLPPPFKVPEDPPHSSPSRKVQTEDGQSSPLEVEEGPPENRFSSRSNPNKLLFDNDEDSDDKLPALEVSEDSLQSRLTSSLSNDEDLNYGQPSPSEDIEELPQTRPISSSCEVQTDDVQHPPLEVKDPPQNRSSSLSNQIKLSFDSDGDSDESLQSGLTSSLSKDGDSDDGQRFLNEDPLQSKPKFLSRKDQIKLLFDSDDDSDDGQTPPHKVQEVEDSPQCRLTSSSSEDDNSDDEQPSLQQMDEKIPQSMPTFSYDNEQIKSLFDCNRDSVDEQNSLLKEDEISTQHTPSCSPRTDHVKLLFDCNEQTQLLKDEPTCLQIQASPPIEHDSDLDSVDSNNLVIDDGNIEDDNEAEQLANAEPTITLPVAKRKRKSSSCSSCENQPFEKRLTRSQAKLLEFERETKAVIKTIDSVKVAKELQSSCITSSSPMSPVAGGSCEEENDSEPIEIPLEQPGGEHSASEPKALLCYVVNEVKADAKHRDPQKQLLNKSEMEQLQLKIVNCLKKSVPLDTTCIKLITDDETVAFDVIITAYGELQDDSALERILSVVGQIECQRGTFIERFMSSLEQRLFSLKERLDGQLAHKYVRLYLQLTELQSTLTVPGQGYLNPARLLLAKILYHYNRDVIMLVLEVLRHFPTVLPHREERDYDNGDPLITVIKHLLMSHKYDMQDAQGPDRALLSKLRFEYHFQPYEPTKQQVIENLVEKLKAGRLHHLSYAFALFCRRSVALQVTKDVLETHLLPLVNTYCDLCMQSEEYDARVECLLQSVSMIVKQLPLHSKMDISNYIALFKRLLVAVPRPGVQQAAVQAILRTQRFGYGFALEALQSYRPNYQLSPMTRAMMRSFAERRVYYKQGYKTAAWGQNK
ncbi:hypothetical protein ACLKA6_015183 [Drosophila palustris]